MSLISWPTLPSGSGHNHRALHNDERTALNAYVSTAGGRHNVVSQGAVGNGVANDSNAVLQTINNAPSGGIVYFPPGTYNLSSWSSPVITKQLFVIGDGATVIGPGSATFLNMRNSLFMRGLTTQGFLYPVDFSSATGTIDMVDIDRCVFRDSPIDIRFISTTRAIRRLRVTNSEMYNGQQAIFITGMADSVLIENNVMDTFTSRGVQIGQDVFAMQDTWQHMIITKNDIRNIVAPTNASCHGIIVYGRYADISHNQIRDVRTNGGPDSSGIYTKARYTDVHHNTLVDAGNGEGCLNVKGQQSWSTTQGPQGFSTRYNDNMVFGTDPQGPIIYHGIQIANENVEVARNWFSGLNGTLIQWSASASGDHITVRDNWMVDNFTLFGIRRSGQGKQQRIIGNQLIDSGAIDIRATAVGGDVIEIARNHVRRVSGTTSHPCITLNMGAGFAVPLVIVKNNEIIGGGRGLHVTGEAPQTLVVDDNEFRANQLVPVLFSSTPATIRRRNNRGWDTENFGTATIANGQSSISVNHGLVDVPTAVTATARGGELVWISARTSTTFTITRTGTSGALAVDWRAQVA